MGEDDSGVLNDHKRDGKEFQPPMVAELGERLSSIKWRYNVIPEVIWIGLLIENLGAKRGIKVLGTCMEEAQKIDDEQIFAYASDYKTLDEDEIEQLRENLGDDIGELENALSSIDNFYPDFPLSRLLETSEDENEEKLKEIAGECYDRTSRTATLIQAAIVRGLMKTEKLAIAEDTMLTEINEIEHYPETEKSKKVAAGIRSMLNIQFGLDVDDTSEWSTQFWQRGLEISDCEYVIESSDEEKKSREDSKDVEELLKMGEKYEEELRDLIRDKWDSSQYQPDFMERGAVYDGLLMHQVEIATVLATNPSLWNKTIGDTLIRSMSEVHITLSWFLKEGEREDFEDFIEHGLGQDKLLLEHAENYSNDEDSEGVNQRLTGLRERINEQKLTYFVSVNVSTWKGVRDMAKEADVKELYDLTFSPCSDTAHGMWNALEKQSLTRCANPLHKFHRIPDFKRNSANPYVVIRATQIMESSLKAWMNSKELEYDPEEHNKFYPEIKEFLMTDEN